MKIIFKDETEREVIITCKCPRDIHPDAVENSDCGNYRKYPYECTECWENSGIEMEVKNETGN